MVVSTDLLDTKSVAERETFEKLPLAGCAKVVRLSLAAIIAPSDPVIVEVGLSTKKIK